MPTNTRTKTISVTPTITAASAYTTGDAVGGLLTFSDAALKGYGSGVVQTITIVDKDSEEDTLHLHLFNQTFTASTDHDVFSPSDADLENYIGRAVVRGGSFLTFEDNSAGSTFNVGLYFNLVAGGTDLFGQLVVAGTPTYTGTSDLIVKITVEQY